MTAVLISGVALIAAGMFLLGAYCHRAVENALRWLLVKLMPDQGAHSVPAGEIERAFAGSGPQQVESPAVSGGTPEDAPARPGQGTSGVITTSLLAAATAAHPFPQPRGRHARPPLTEQTIPTMRIGTQPWDTASFAAQPDEPAPADEPTDQQTYDLYFAEPADQQVPASLFPCCRHCDDGTCQPHHVACMDCQAPVYGETSVAGVLAAEDGAQPVMQP